ncbi:MAG: hypothetical protein D8M59_11270 [Planctomycetes bacterium]|nr:hypothetical protein [Planctomycetota bacterium]
MVASGAAALLIGSNSLGGSDALDDLRETNPRARFLEEGGRVTQVYGPGLSHGTSPRDSAESFLQDHADVFGVPLDQIMHEPVTDGLQFYEDQPLMYEAGIGDFKLSAVYYSQQYEGLPVWGAQLIAVMRNEPGYPVVLVNSSLIDVQDLQIPIGALGNGPVTPPFGFEFVTDPQPVVYFDPTIGEEGKAFVGFEYIARQGQPGEPVMLDVSGQPTRDGTYDVRRFIVNADNGQFLLNESLVRTVDVVGNATGWGTPGLLPDQANNPEQLLALPFFNVSILGGNTAETDDLGDFVIAHGGNTEVTVRSTMVGPSLSAGVNDQSGGNLLLDVNVTPPGPANFEHNVAKGEYDTAEVNAMRYTALIHAWVYDINPTYPSLFRSFRANVNLASTCNAYYDGVSTNFYRSGGGCPNTAYSTVVWHEYGHKLIDDAATGPSGDYHEGMADAISAVLPDTSHLGEDFRGQGTGPLRDADNNLQYPCSGEVHYCGQVVSGCVWHTRDALTVTEPNDYLSIIQALTINSIPIHSGGVGPAMTVEFLTLDDDDGDIGNGTPHYFEIDEGFGRHNLPAPPLELLSFSYPNGLPDLLEPDGGTTVRVEVSANASNPEPGTGLLYYDDGSGWTSLAMDIVSDNVYDAVFPAFDCESLVNYYFAAQTTGGAEGTDPAGAPFVATYSAFAAKYIDVIFDDNFETDQGWTVVNENLTTGAWTRVIPNQGGARRGDPQEDADGSGKCFVTGNGFEEDIDGGPTRLLSPTFDMSAGDGFVRYARWWYNDDNDIDRLTVEVSNNNGANWTTVESVSHVGELWQTTQFRVSDYVSPTATMKLRFSATDNPNDSVSEGGIDAVQILILDCNRMRLDVDPLIGGQNATLYVTGATPTEHVYFVYSLRGEGSTYVSSLDVTLELMSPKLAGDAIADANGDASITKSVPMAAMGRLVWMQAAEYQRLSNLVLSQVN